MRIITGKYKGRKLKAPKGLTTRPTSDKMKESIFNIISPISYNSEVLDLFAGSGAVAFEFISRGSTSAYLVDRSEYAIQAIKYNIEHIHFDEDIKVLKSDAQKALYIFKESNLSFDYIFLDPPYAEKNYLQKIFDIIVENNLIKIGGTVIIESDEDLKLKIYSEEYLIDIRRYGHKSLYIIKRS